MAYQDVALSATISAAGTATITIRTTGRQRWTVSQVSPEAPNVGASAAGVLRKNGSLIAPFVPQGDAIAGEPPVVIGPNDELTLEWSGGTSGAACKALVIYDDGLR